jgi:hypothetical protein
MAQGADLAGEHPKDVATQATGALAAPIPEAGDKPIAAQLAQQAAEPAAPASDSGSGLGSAQEGGQQSQQAPAAAEPAQ